VAYQCGNAANIAPPAVINQTSLASQNGPIVLIYTRFSVSSFPKKRETIPTPKSKPSKTKKPTNNIVINMNQNSLRDNFRTSFIIERILCYIFFKIIMVLFLNMFNE